MNTHNLKMNSADFSLISEFVYGKNWARSLAEDFEVNPRTVRHWRSDKESRYRVPERVENALYAMAAKKQTGIAASLIADFLGKIKGEVPIVELRAYKGGGKWSFEADLEIKKKIALLFHEKGIKTEIVGTNS